MHISESKRCYNVIPSVHYFYVNTKMSVDFQICISVSFLAYRHHHYVGLDFDIITSWKIYKEAKKNSPK